MMSLNAEKKNQNPHPTPSIEIQQILEERLHLDIEFYEFVKQRLFIQLEFLKNRLS